MKRKSKKMTADEIRTQVTDAIIAALEKGTVPWRRPWNCEAGSGMPHNCITGHAYKGINVVYLWSMETALGYPTSQWLTYNQAKKAGGSVRKGEKAAAVIFCKPITVKDREKPEDENAKRKIFFMRTTPVFNIAQCDDVKLPKRELPPEPEDIKVRSEDQIVKATLKFAKAAGAKVKWNGGRAYFHPKDDYIGMPKAETFETAEGFAATLLHELTHWTGGESRLDRHLVNAFGSEAYAHEELVAEIGSAMLCAHHEVSSEMPNHASYIKSWLKALKNDTTLIFKASKKSEAAFNYLVPEQARQEDEVAEQQAA